MNQFLTLDEVRENQRVINIDNCYKDQVKEISFKPKLRNRIDGVQVLALVVVAINTPLPTMSPITNPIIYKKITKNLSSHKIIRIWNKIKMRVYNAFHK